MAEIKTKYGEYTTFSVYIPSALYREAKEKRINFSHMLKMALFRELKNSKKEGV